MRVSVCVRVWVREGDRDTGGGGGGGRGGEWVILYCFIQSP